MRTGWLSPARHKPTFLTRLKWLQPISIDDRPAIADHSRTKGVLVRMVRGPFQCICYGGNQCTGNLMTVVERLRVADDSVTRAIAIATGKPYRKVYDRLMI